MSQPCSRKNLIRSIRQSIGQKRIPTARRKNNIWWFKPDVHLKIFPKLNVYQRLHPKVFNFRYFGRFIYQHPKKRNLYECTHALPFRGVGCFLSRHDPDAKERLDELRRDWEAEPKANEDDGSSLLDNSADGSDEKNGEEEESHAKEKWIKSNMNSIFPDDARMYYRPRRVHYTIRPFLGVMTGDLIQNGRIIRTNIQQHLRHKTEWHVQLPNPAPLSQYRPPIPFLLHDAFCRPEYPKGIPRSSYFGSLIDSNQNFAKHLLDRPQKMKKSS